MRAALLSAIFFVTALTASHAHADATPPRIEHTPVTRAIAGSPLTIEARISDESEIFAATLYYRELGQRSYVSVPMKQRNGLFFAEFTIRGSVEYWLEAYDEYGNGPAREGEPAAPFRITSVSAEVAERERNALEENGALGQVPAESPFYKEVWFIASASVVGAALVGVVVYALLPTDVYRNTFSATVTRP